MYDYAYDLMNYYRDQTGYEKVMTGQLSTTQDEIVVFYSTGGEPQQLVHSPNSEGLKYPTVQVRIRGEANDYVTARERAESVYNTLHNVSDITANSHNYQRIIAVSDPIWLGRDDNNRPEWSINFEIVI